MDNDHEVMCNFCGDDERTLSNNKHYGWVCDDCLAEYKLIDVMTDWDEHERKKRERIAEQNEY